MKIDVYLKWIATATLVIGSFINSAFPELYPIGPVNTDSWWCGMVSSELHVA